MESSLFLTYKKGILMNLPDAITSSMCGIKPRKVNYPHPTNVLFYADTMTVDSFNSLILIHVSMLREQFCYMEAEHEDWVSSHKHSEYTLVDVSEKKTKKKGPKEVRLLDSWALKMPVSLVPDEEELKEEFDWRQEHRPGLAGLEPKASTVEDLQEAYMMAACLDLKTHGVLLGRWDSCGRPRDQSDASTKDGRVFLIQKAKQQTFNKLAASHTLEKLSSWQAPIFMLERAFGRVCYEEKVLSQIRETIQQYR